MYEFLGVFFMYLWRKCCCRVELYA